MKRSLPRLYSALFAVIFTVIGSHSFAQNALTISDGETAGLAPETLSVLMDSDAGVQGFVLAITYDTSLLAVSDVEAGSATLAATAELVVPETLGGGFTLGVVLDATAPFDGQEIPAGAGLEIAAFTMSPLALVGAATDTAIEFSDGVLNNPPLSNLIVQGGQSVDASTGLGLNNGLLTLLPPPPDSIRIESSEITADEGGPARILLTNVAEVQGFVLAIAHDPEILELTDIEEGDQTLDAELFITEIYPGNGLVGSSGGLAGGTVGCVMDFAAPYDGLAIPAGVDNHIASYIYNTVIELVEPAPPITTNLTFVNGVFGDPPLDNVIVGAGISIDPGLEDEGPGNGGIVVNPSPPPPVSDTAFYIGQRDFPDTGTNGGSGFPGQEIEFCFFYSDPTDNIQGVQIAVCYDDLLLIDGTFSIEGSIADELGAEFVHYQIDNNDNDGDGRELVAGILMDALPPFENQQLPTTTEPMMIACVDAEVDGGATCGDSFSIDFCDGINGNGMVDINNMAVIEYQSIQDFLLVGADYEIIPVPAFLRGDCNTDTLVDLSDAATVIATEFQGYNALCLDACDSNDDGIINLADSVYLLNFLFSFGDPTPDPGPYSAGEDPTEDALDCALPAACN